jgi:hypothetical protein
MKQIKVQTKIALVDDEDFEELNKYKWFLNNTGYAMHQFWKNNKPKHILMHRYILKQFNKGFITDHIDRNPLNNQKSNLRICTQSENVFNSPKKKNNKSGSVGVRLRNDILTPKWEAYIMKDRVKHHLGLFCSFEEAVRARGDAEKLLFPNFTRTI